MLDNWVVKLKEDNICFAKIKKGNKLRDIIGGRKTGGQNMFDKIENRCL